jgi:hypothetical protein
LEVQLLTPYTIHEVNKQASRISDK